MISCIVKVAATYLHTLSTSMVVPVKQLSVRWSQAAVGRESFHREHATSDARNVRRCNS